MRNFSGLETIFTNDIVINVNEHEKFKQISGLIF